MLAPGLALLRASATARWRASSTPGRGATCAATARHDVDAECRALVRALGAGGWLRHAWAASRTAARPSDRHPRALPGPRDAGAPRRPGRLRVRDAGPGLGRDQPGRHARAARALAAEGGARRGDRGLRAVRARGRLRRRGDAVRARIDGDHAVLDGEKTWISNGGIADFYVVFARTGERRARAASRPSSSRPARRASRSPSAST
jgi:acyl-CoA dehydrogenase